MSQVIFEEDVPVYKKRPSFEKIPEKGLEGWVYDKTPLDIKVTKYALQIFTTIFFFASISFLFLGFYKINSVDKDDTGFVERIEKTETKEE